MHKVYLACPYSHRNKYIERTRFYQANIAAAKLMEQGFIVFSPLSHTVPISKFVDKSNDTYEFWLTQDFAYVDWADSLYVLCLPGWDKSKGVKLEIERANAQNKIVRYLKPDEL